MGDVVPQLGALVRYTLTKADADAINRRRDDAKKWMQVHPVHRENYHGAMVHVGNVVTEGEQCPAIIVGTWGDTTLGFANLKVLLDGNDAFWATTRAMGDGPGSYQTTVEQANQAEIMDELRRLVTNTAGALRCAREEIAALKAAQPAAPTPGEDAAKRAADKAAVDAAAAIAAGKAGPQDGAREGQKD